MKKNKFFAAICFLVFAAYLNCQEVTPLQLKEARLEVYKWTNKYTQYSHFIEGEVSQRGFLSLFESPETLITNDYLPTTEDSLISVSEYLKIMLNPNPAYKIDLRVTSVRILRDFIDEQTYCCILLMGKEVAYSDSTNVFSYPAKAYTSRISLVYNLNDQRIYCNQITSEDSLRVELVNHTSEGNEYISFNDTVDMCKEESVLEEKSLHHEAHDFKMVYVETDTLKNAIGLGIMLGPSFYNAKFGTDNLRNFNNKAQFMYGIYISYYRELILKNKFRHGLDFSIRYTQSKYCFGGTYYEEFDAIDTDGGPYIRQISTENYKELFQKYSFDIIPISYRFDYFCGRQLTFYATTGIIVSYDLKQKSKANAITEYAGYYSWLFDVTMNQNGIYDFGKYEWSATANQTAINRFGLGLYIGVGVQYYIPKSRWAIEGGVTYENVCYKPIEKINDYHLTEKEGSWNTITSQFSSFIPQNINFNIQVKYNFVK